MNIPESSFSLLSGRMYFHFPFYALETMSLKKKRIPNINGFFQPNRISPRITSCLYLTGTHIIIISTLCEISVFN